MTPPATDPASAPAFVEPGVIASFDAHRRRRASHLRPALPPAVTDRLEQLLADDPGLLASALLQLATARSSVARDAIHRPASIVRLPRDPRPPAA